jgi:oxygen-independent coproporphyrinogen-3 oxidase
VRIFSSTQVLPNEGSDPKATESFGVYVHIPFCAQRCDYCAFSTWTDKGHLVARYIDACLVEIGRAQRDGVLGSCTTVFIGGGTPSFIGAAPLCRIIEALPCANDVEITVECNPESTTPELLRSLELAGVTRISLGVQSFSEHVLKSLGRTGDPTDAARAVSMIGAAGFTNFNVDLIFGGAGESASDWAESLERATTLDPVPPHISAYALSVERGTPLSRDFSRHPNDDVLADRYAFCDAYLSDAGYSWYEVSNWAKRGHECRHNVDCWAQGDYLGIGCSAHSHLDGKRFANTRVPERYINAIEHGRSPLETTETLAGNDRVIEALELALRTRWGVPNWALPNDPDLKGLVVRRGGRAVLSVKGRLLMNEVALRLQCPPSGDPTPETQTPTLGGLFDTAIA